jgi:hypothetical protein
MNLPEARTTEIVENELDKEILIYDLRIDKAYALNETSKIVFKACSNKLTFDELKHRYRFTDDLIYLALDGLKKENLLEGDYISPFAGMNRREVIKKVGLTSIIALPVIFALIAPTAAHSASGCPPVSSTNLPSGCPAGFVSFGQHNCDPVWNSERISFCQPSASKCGSRGITYGTICNNNPAGGYSYNCVCR